MDIKPPASSPKGGRPRKKNPRTRRNFQYNNSQSQPRKPHPPDQPYSPQIHWQDERRRINRSDAAPISRSERFYSELKTFIDTELSYSRNDSNRIFVYKQAFDTLIQEFQLCRPILERIKKNYDELSNELLHTKTNIRVEESTSMEITDDTFDEIVNSMKRIKEKEIKKSEMKADELLDKMTQLRVSKSDLTKELEAVESKRKDLKIVDKSLTEKIYDAQTKLFENTAEIRVKKAKISSLQQKIQKLEEKFSDTECSSQELHEQDQSLEKQLNDIVTKENNNSSALTNLLNEQKELDAKIADLENENWELQRQNRLIEQKYESIKQRKEYSDRNILDKLSKFDNHIEDPIIDILHRLSKQYYKI